MSCKKVKNADSLTHGIKHHRIFAQHAEYRPSIVKLHFLRKRDVFFEKLQLVCSLSGIFDPRLWRAAPSAKHEVFYHFCHGHSTHATTASELRKTRSISRGEEE